jgi:FkbH-like protein
MLNWLPTPSDFRGKYQAALRVTNAGERLHCLASLAQHQLGFLETIQLDRALAEFVTESPSGFSRLRLAILASTTIDHLAPAIRVAGLRRGLLLDVYIGGYGQYRQELWDAASPLWRFSPQLIVLSITAREAIEAIPITATPEAVRKGVDQFVSELRVLWRRARESFNATVIQQTFLNITDPLFGNLDRQVAAAPSAVVARLNDELSNAAASDGVLLLDIARAAERNGTDFWFDRARWFQAKQEISPQAAPMYGDLLVRIIAAQQGLSRKCLVLDLDNTLWHGVIGDDGIDGIVLGQGSAVGEAHLSLQRYAKQLMDRGIILAVCSKNDRAVAEEIFQKHPEMILRRSDFAAFMANWKDKAENLKAIAAQLNLGIDSLVFVDDNPVERARVRQALPVVAVPELPEDVANYARCLADAGYFESVSFTREDQHRTTQYAANVEREALRGSTENMEEFLQGLGMSMDFGPFAAIDLPRIAQLINKTNQFNPTTRRRNLDEIAGLAADARNLTLQFRLVDRFGDNGLVMAMILLQDPVEPDVLAIDTWVMSCRVFGRQLEFEAMNVAVDAALKRGVRSFRGEYIPTAKNGIVSELFPRLGFTHLREPASRNGQTNWIMSLNNHVPKATYIAKRAAA